MSAGNVAADVRVVLEEVRMMKYASALKWLVPLIGVLASFAAGMGVFYGEQGQPFPTPTSGGRR
jgi:hypothetical protein